MDIQTTNDPLLARLRVKLQQLAEGLDTDSPRAITSIVLMHDGHLHGWCYHCGGFRAIYDIRAARVEIRSANDRLLETLARAPDALPKAA